MAPEGWRCLPIREAVERVSTGVSVKSSSAPRGPGDLAVLKTSAVTYGTFNPSESKTVLKEEYERAREHPRRGCVLVSRMNTVDLVGAAVYVEKDYEDLVLPDRIWQVWPKNGLADGRWLQSWLSSPQVRARLREAASGTSGSMKNIAQDRFLDLEALIPPLVEQRRIASILSSVDDAIEAAQAVIDQLQVVKKALMTELLTRGLPGRHKRFKMTEIGDVPEEWVVTRLGDVLEGIDAGWSPQCDTVPAAPSEWGVLKVSAASWGEFLPEENKRLPGTLAPRPELEVHAGDLVLSRANTINLVGRSVLVRQPTARRMLSDKLLRLRPRSDVAVPGFVNLLLETQLCRSQIEDGASGSSGSMKNISQEVIRGLKVPLPSVEEQRAMLGLADGVAERRTASLGHCEALRLVKSTLAEELLAGRLRVPAAEAAA